MSRRFHGQPELSGGFTPISNELLEAFVGADLTGLEREVFLVVARLTYGYHRKDAQIGVALIRLMIHRNRAKIAQAVRALIDKKILKVVKGYNRGCSRTLTINKYYGQWKVYPKRDTQKQSSVSQQGYPMIPPVSQEGDSSVSPAGHQTVSQEGYYLKQENNKTSTPSAEAEEVCNYYVEKVRSVNNEVEETVSSIEELLKSGLTVEQLRLCVDGYCNNGMKRDPDYRFKSHNFFGRREEYKKYLPGNEGVHVYEFQVRRELAGELVNRGIDSKESFQVIPGSELVMYHGSKNLFAVCKELHLTDEGVRT